MVVAFKLPCVESRCAVSVCEREGNRDIFGVVRGEVSRKRRRKGSGGRRSGYEILRRQGKGLEV